MNWMGYACLILIFFSLGTMFVFGILYREHPQRGLRQIQSFNRLRRAIGLAVEDGSRLHVSLGSANILTPQTASSLVGLSLLERVSHLGSLSDRPPVVTSGDGALGVLSQDTLRSGFQDAFAIEQYDPARGMVTGLTPFSYAVGAVSTIKEENISANILVGHFGPEVMFITDAIEQKGTFSIAGSDSLIGQAVLYTTIQEPLIGEEAFAGGAYLQVNQFHPASLRTEDVLRWLIGASLIIGSILKLVGIL